MIRRSTRSRPRACLSRSKRSPGKATPTVPDQSRLQRCVNLAVAPGWRSSGGQRGTALVMALVFALLLLQMAISYSGMLRQSKPQTLQLEEGSKFELLAQGLIDKAILKFQLYPGEFYAAWRAAQLNNPAYLNEYVNDANLRLTEFSTASSSFSETKISVFIASMALLTDSRWNQEALRIIASVTYLNQSGKVVDKSVVKIITVKREVIK